MDLVMPHGNQVIQELLIEIGLPLLKEVKGEEGL